MSHYLSLCSFRCLAFMYHMLAKVVLSSHIQPNQVCSKHLVTGLEMRIRSFEHSTAGMNNENPIYALIG
ncbi:hypothetical protein M404DRAFT_1003320 [Pisolithus tinctorius Marx 270]|uniref:Secreted protein n=1 Tax=Pisolithus tinctorius Marx 270 TaxID=870435 RepID=A0A0C3P0Z9_PISTI|nr:hypothetical protein M404DRAFT_1003320 [Pisolithus tinctorius Marx 270]